MEMPHTCTIYRRQWQKTTHLGHKESRRTLYEDEPCWVQLAGVREQKTAQKRDQIVTHSVYFTRELNLEPGDELLIAGGGFDGDELEYKASADATVGLGFFFKAMTEEIRKRN